MRWFLIIRLRVKAYNLSSTYLHPGTLYLTLLICSVHATQIRFRKIIYKGESNPRPITIILPTISVSTVHYLCLLMCMYLNCRCLSRDLFIGVLHYSGLCICGERQGTEPSVLLQLSLTLAFCLPPTIHNLYSCNTLQFRHLHTNQSTEALPTCLEAFLLSC